jgi:hypothetical protein
MSTLGTGGGQRRVSAYSGVGPGGGGGSAKSLRLFEFLEEAELQHHYLGIKNGLQVSNVSQLRHVADDDFFSIGMSKAEARRLKVLSARSNEGGGGGGGGTYAAKLKRLLMPRRAAAAAAAAAAQGGNTDDARQEFLLGGDDEACRNGIH